MIPTLFVLFLLQTILVLFVVLVMAVFSLPSKPSPSKPVLPSTEFDEDQELALRYFKFWCEEDIPFTLASESDFVAKEEVKYAFPLTELEEEVAFTLAPEPNSIVQVIKPSSLSSTDESLLHCNGNEESDETCKVPVISFDDRSTAYPPVTDSNLPRESFPLSLPSKEEDEPPSYESLFPSKTLQDLFPSGYSDLEGFYWSDAETNQIEDFPFSPTPSPSLPLQNLFPSGYSELEGYYWLDPETTVYPIYSSPSKPFLEDDEVQPVCPIHPSPSAPFFEPEETYPCDIYQHNLFPLGYSEETGYYW